jgi:hypothetical protein
VTRHEVVELVTWSLLIGGLCFALGAGWFGALS